MLASLIVGESGIGHELLTKIIRYALILDKYSRPQLACFASQWVDKTWLRFSIPDVDEAVRLLSSTTLKAP